MRTPAIIGIAAIGAAAILGGSAVAIAEITHSHSQPVAAATPGPAPGKTIIKKIEHKTVVVSPNANAAAPLNNLRQVSPGVYANQNTSDAFAEAVAAAYNGSPVQDVYSPVTGQTYAMTYAPQPDGTVTATGGNNAYVQFRWDSPGTAPAATGSGRSPSRAPASGPDVYTQDGTGYTITSGNLVVH